MYFVGMSTISGTGELYKMLRRQYQNPIRRQQSLKPVDRMADQCLSSEKRDKLLGAGGG